MGGWEADPHRRDGRLARFKHPRAVLTATLRPLAGPAGAASVPGQVRAQACPGLVQRANRMPGNRAASGRVTLLSGRARD